MLVVLQVQCAQDIDPNPVSASLLHLHQRAVIVSSLKTWLHVLHVGIITCVMCAINFNTIFSYC